MPTAFLIPGLFLLRLWAIPQPVFLFREKEEMDDKAEGQPGISKLFGGGYSGLRPFQMEHLLLRLNTWHRIAHN